jgi:hypothetical protein
MSPGSNTLRFGIRFSRTLIRTRPISGMSARLARRMSPGTADHGDSVVVTFNPILNPDGSTSETAGQATLFWNEESQSAVESSDGCRTFELLWNQYIAYLVTEEVVGSGGSDQDETYTGHLLRVYTESHQQRGRQRLPRCRLRYASRLNSGVMPTRRRPYESRSRANLREGRS